MAIKPLKNLSGHVDGDNLLYHLLTDLIKEGGSAATGCADMKRLLAERLTAHYAPARERYHELLALPHEVDNILGDGAARLLPIVTETMREVKEKVGLA